MQRLDAGTFKARVLLAGLYYHPEMWYECAMFLNAHGDVTGAKGKFEAGLQA